MGKNAVRKKVQEFTRDLARATLDETQQIEAIDTANKDVSEEIEDKLSQSIIDIKTSLHNQFCLIIEFIDQGKDDRNEFHTEFIRHDIFYRNYFGDASKSKQFQDDLKIYFNEVTEQLEPVVDSNQKRFWDSMKEEYSRDQGINLIETMFTRTDQLSDYKNGLEFSVDIKDKTTIQKIDLSDVTLEALNNGENKVTEKLTDKAEEIYN